jgi:hypothetical protein
MQTSSKALAKKPSSVLLSSFALWANPLVQAKMEAKRETKNLYFTCPSYWDSQMFNFLERAFFCSCGELH